MLAGNLAVVEAGGSLVDYYWEIYHNMGDPSVSTYFGIPEENNLSHTEFLPIGSSSISISGEPYTYVGLTHDGNLLGSGQLDRFGNIELEEVGAPHKLKWNRCKLETISFGHGITTTPLQATALYASLINGGELITPSLIKNRKVEKPQRIISSETSYKLRHILRKVVSSNHGTASLANIQGYHVGGKTGTAESYGDKKNRINTFISIFPANKPDYALFVMLENPKINKELIYDYRGVKTKAPYNTSGWNSVYVAGKIIKKIGPILAINNKEFTNQHVVEKIN